MLNFGNVDTKFPLPSSAARAWSALSEKEKKKNDKRIVAMPLPKQGYKIFFLAIVVMALPKMGEKSYEIYERVKKKSCHVHNIFTTFSQQIIGDQLLLVQI